MEPLVTDRPAPATWPEFFADLTRRLVTWGRSRWNSAGPQPAWARPALLVIAAAAAWSYAWRATRPVNIEIYYAAAVRSMSMSLPNFFFGAFDPARTMTLDKLPGAFWLQAISAALFGAHTWALVLPQVIEGTATVLVLYRVVRRQAGPAAALIAAGILAISPATIALNRGNISDTLMILLAVLAADSVTVAASTGRWRPLLLAGLWVGLAFQAKMLEAWLILPALAACYLMAAPGSLRQRASRCGAMVALAVAVSLSWMSMVTILPAGSRPYIDGSTDNSAFQQVFVYNGLGRLDQATPDQLLNKTIRLGIPISPPPSWHRLLSGDLGRDSAWLLAAAVIALIAGLAARRTPRTDLARAGLLLWGIWLLTLFAAFSAAATINTYYVAALSPAVAALLGIGLVLGWQHRTRIWSPLALLAAVAATASYDAWLLPASGTGLPGWLRQSVFVLAAVAACCLAARCWQRRSAVVAAASAALAVVAVLIVPAAAAAAVMTSGLGPFEAPFESARETAHIAAFQAAGFNVQQSLAALERGNAAEPYLMATQTSALAAPFIWASGREVVPIGGFTGTIPSPTLATLQHLIRVNFVRTFLQSPTTTDPRLVWVARNCLHITKRAPGQKSALPIAVYYCLG